MQRKQIKRIGAIALAAILTLQCTGNLLTANAANSETQMSSEKEVVYVNTYNSTERKQNFDENWKFYLGDASGADQKNFDDSRWENVSLPHDYSIEQEYSTSMEAESGYLPGGTGWYRKHFVVGTELEGKQLRIDFGGVYMNATVWVNGTELGTHPYGYTPFSFDITEYVNVGEENVITVKVDHKTPSSRWYSGSGIYRSVNLTVVDSVHVDLYGTKIETPNLETQQGGLVDMAVKTTVANVGDAAADVTLVHTVYEKGTENSIGTVTTEAKSVAAGANAEITATLKANNPALWSTETPNLYTVRTEVKVGNEVVDSYDTEYGFRYIEFDTETGFYLNGENVKLKGVCMHHDQGSLGAEAYYRAIERQVEILQEMGCNSIRVTHNPAADELIQICNEKGILVIDEVFDGWMYAKNGNSNDYAKWFNVSVESDNQIIGKEDQMTWAEFDLKTTIKRGQNAPSVIMYSLGNEIQEGAGGSGYANKATELIAWAREIDTTKPLTIGSNVVKSGWAEHIDIANQLTAVGGVSGTNYSDGNSYDSLHRTYPQWFLYGSETASSVNSRGVYYKANGSDSNQDLTSYDQSKVGWGAYASAAWYDVITRDFVAGEYVWTGFDYIGEPTPWNGTNAGAKGQWPSPKNSFFGIIDTAGLPKDSYYFYQSQWNDDVTTLHVLPAWNEDVVVSAATVPVVVYSDAAAVELFFTPAGSEEAQSLGKKEFETVTTGAGYTYQIYDDGSADHQNLYLTWNVAYADGTLTAVAYDADGNVINETVGRSFVTTTGEEAKLDATVDRTTIEADGKDLAYITVNVTDADGNIVPDAANKVTFNVEGDGVLVGVDNGKQTDHQSYQDNNRKAYNGSLIAIVQSTKAAGEFTVTATADGLESDSVTVTTKAVESEETTVQVESFYMSKNYYVKVGNMPELPAKIETRYTDGTSKELDVVWETIETSKVESVGTFGVNGVVDGLYTVSVTVNMLDELGGLLNYSTTTAIGVAPILPDTRAAVSVDGEILNVAFPVEWEAISADQYKEEGTFVVEGTSNVLGQEMTVSASVRVQEETLTIEGSVDNPFSMTQDIPEELQSDTLSAIWDGSTEIGANTDGGVNETAWSNYNNSQAGDTTAEITFEYATQQRLGEITIHFWKDGYAAEHPDAGTTEIYVSETGKDGSWTKVDTTETIGTENNRVKAYTYTFTPVTATFVKFCLTNSTAQKTAKTCTGITEIEIKKATGTFTTYTKAELEALTVNDTELTADEIAEGICYVIDKEATVTAVGKDNAAVTVLPTYDNKIKIIVESEDHKTRDTFVIRLGEEKPLDPADDSKDVPVSNLTAISDSQYLPGTAQEGPDDYILDGNSDTHWHTNWMTAEATSVDKRWVGVELSEATVIGGIRYLPRTYGGSNGAVMQYKVEYKAAADGEWITVATGTWDKTDSAWKYVAFENAVTAVQVRVVGVTTYADSGNDSHMSTAELRVVYGEGAVQPGPDPTPDVELVPGEDYPVANITASAGSSQNSETLALDGNTDTYWETRWSNQTTDNNAGKLWFQLELDEAAEVNQLRYYPRYQGTNLNNGDQNGFISKYKVEVSMDGKEWTAVAEGNWEPADAWLTADFATTMAKYVRLVGVETLNNGNATTTDMSIAEIRVRVAEEEEEIPTVEKEALNAKISAATELAKDDYTSASWAEFAEALEAAQEVAAKEDATQEEVDNALKALEAAMTGLKTKADKTALSLKLAEAKELKETDYTADSWKALAEALTKAEAVMENEEVTVDEVKEALNAVSSAMNALVKKANKVGLSENIVEAKSKTSTDYTEESWAAVTEALAKAEEVAAKEDATQEEVDAASKALKEALTGLELKDTKPENPDKDPDKDPVVPDQKPDEKPEDKPTAPETGDSAPIFVWAMVAFVMAVIGFTAKKRTK